MLFDDLLPADAATNNGQFGSLMERAQRRRLLERQTEAAAEQHAGALASTDLDLQERMRLLDTQRLRLAEAERVGAQRARLIAEFDDEELAHDVNLVRRETSIETQRARLNSLWRHYGRFRTEPKLAAIVDAQLGGLEPQIAAGERAHAAERKLANMWAATAREAAERFPGRLARPYYDAEAKTTIHLVEDRADPGMEEEAVELVQHAFRTGNRAQLENVPQDPVFAAVVRIPGNRVSSMYARTLDAARKQAVRQRILWEDKRKARRAPFPGLKDPPPPPKVPEPEEGGVPGEFQRSFERDEMVGYGLDFGAVAAPARERSFDIRDPIETAKAARQIGKTHPELWVRFLAGEDSALDEMVAIDRKNMAIMASGASFAEYGDTPEERAAVHKWAAARNAFPKPTLGDHAKGLGRGVGSVIVGGLKFLARMGAASYQGVEGIPSDPDSVEAQIRREAAEKTAATLVEGAQSAYSGYRQLGAAAGAVLNTDSELQPFLDAEVMEFALEEQAKSGEWRRWFGGDAFADIEVDEDEVNFASGFFEIDRLAFGIRGAALSVRQMLLINRVGKLKRASELAAARVAVLEKKLAKAEPALPGESFSDAAKAPPKEINVLEPMERAKADAAKSSAAKVDSAKMETAKVDGESPAGGSPVHTDANRATKQLQDELAQARQAEAAAQRQFEMARAEAVRDVGPTAGGRAGAALPSVGEIAKGAAKDAVVSGGVAYATSGGDSVAAAEAMGGSLAAKGGELVRDLVRGHSGVGAATTGGTQGRSSGVVNDPRVSAMADLRSIKPLRERLSSADHAAIDTFSQTYPEIRLRVVEQAGAPASYYDRETNTITVNAAHRRPIGELIRRHIDSDAKEAARRAIVEGWRVKDEAAEKLRPKTAPGGASASSSAPDAAEPRVEHAPNRAATEGESPLFYFNKTHKDAKPSPRGRGPSGGKLESHHALQQGWATENLAAFGYDERLAPTITLETKVDHPHTIISKRQMQRRRERVAAGRGPWSSTLQEELGYLVEDLRAVKCSEATIRNVLLQQYDMLEKLKVPFKRLEGFQ